MDNTTIILPSSRAIRSKILHLKENEFLANYLTMSEFISKLCLVEGYTFMDDDTRMLLLLEASDFKEFATLQIERNFFTFTKNSSYIFKFFEELGAELYDIENLSGVDTYAEFEEHILILQTLYRRYEKLCDEKKLLDKIFIPKRYTFNRAYASMQESVRIYVEGHLTNFEQQLLHELSQYCSVEIVINTTHFNAKMRASFETVGFELEVGYEYTLSLNLLRILEKKPLVVNKNIYCQSFSESLLQVAFVKQKLYEFIVRGHKPENIVVILPDEKVASLLREFDTKSNLNFAMGESFTSTKIYTKLQATMDATQQDSKENEARLLRVGEELYLELFSIYKKQLLEVDIKKFFMLLREDADSKIERKIFDEELYSFEKILSFMQEMSVKSVLKLFMQRLAKRSLDDVRGGKVTVMGVLETRGVEFDAAIIVDFDDKNVPKPSDKDMFLNTQIRKFAKLPTRQDRENLQKHYYQMLINRSKEVAISYVSSAQSAPSRFLKQLGIREQNSYDEHEYAKLLFAQKNSQKTEEEPIIAEYSFKNKKLSATALKTFLSCKRKYYYRYVRHLKGHEIPKDMPAEHEIGTDVHKALKELYSKNRSYTSQEALRKDLEKELDNVCGSSELEKYLIKLQKERLKEFYALEIERFNDGWEVFSCEESYVTMFEGMQLQGTIDRIDKRGDEIAVLDYKTGSYTLYTKNSVHDATDFQLEFYHLLASSLGSVVECSFYDLKNPQIVPEAFLQEKLSLLGAHIKDLQNIESLNFEKCEDIKECKFCDYALMCGRV